MGGIENIFDLEDNILALVAAILRDDIYTVEDAFNEICGIKIKKSIVYADEIKALRMQGLKFRELSEIYGVSHFTIVTALRR